MKSPARRSVTGLTFLVLAALVPRPALAQGRCTLESIAGTYAMQALGSSTTISANSAVSGDPMNWSADHAPLAAAGQMTIRPDGKAEGFYWSLNGRLTSGLTPVRWTGRISELDKNACIAIIDFGTPTAQTQSVAAKAVGFILDNGREWRTTAWEPPHQSMAWNGSMRLIGRDPPDARSCGQELIEGRYILQCGGIFSWSGGLPYLGSTTAVQVDIDKAGGYRGAWFGRIGLFMVGPVKGNVKVNPDCTLESWQVLDMFPGLTTTGRGALFDEGRGAYLLMLENTSLPPVPAKAQWNGLCELIRVER